MEKAVFVYKIDVGNKSPQAAAEILQGMMENCSISLSDVEVKNIFLPVKNTNSTVECIYPVHGGTVTKYTPSIKFSKVKSVKSPSRGTAQSAGIDFFIPEEFNEGCEYNLRPNENVLIPSGIKVNVPEGYALIAFNKSGVATKKGLYVGACVVDEDYQGEVHIHVTNVGKETVSIYPGDKIMQFILIPVLYSKPVEVPIEELYESQTERGDGGFGSTDNKN